jgi:hypothetical protein
MYSKRTRLILAVAAGLLGLWQLSIGSQFGWVTLVVVPLMLWGYYRYGPMVLGFQAYHKGDYNRLTTLLREVSEPTLLRAEDRAYYEFLRGVEAQHRGDFAAGRDHIRAALAGPLRTRNMIGIAHLHLGEIELAEGNSSAARVAVADARKYAHREETLVRIAKLDSRVAAI